MGVVFVVGVNVVVVVDRRRIDVTVRWQLKGAGVLNEGFRTH